MTPLTPEQLADLDPVIDNLISSIGEEFIGNMHGTPHEKMRHFSEPSRYKHIARILACDVEGLTNPTEKEINTLFHSQEKPSIRDCSVGNGIALMRFIEAWEESDIPLPGITMSDIVHPEKIQMEDVYSFFQQRGVYVDNRDIRDMQQPDSHSTLSIMSYVHQYLSPDEYRETIKNRLADSDILFITPTNNSIGHVEGMFIFVNESGEIVQYTV